MRTNQKQEGNERITRPVFSPSLLSLPLIAHRVAAGFPSPAEDYVEGTLDLNEHCIAHPATTYFVRATGDSMIGSGIHPGDLLIVDRSQLPADGNVVVVAIDGEVVCKRFRRDPGGVSFHSANRRYAPIRPGEGSEVLVWGVVTFVLHRP